MLINESLFYSITNAQRVPLHIPLPILQKALDLQCFARKIGGYGLTDCQNGMQSSLWLYPW